MIVLFFISSVILPSTGFAKDTDVVINEIHYHPSSDLGLEEYIELFNRGTETVNLSGWAFVEGIFFTFPEGSEIQPGKYVLVAQDQNRVKPLAPTSVIYGNYSGGLGNTGERIKLYNSQGVLIDSLKYSDVPPWPVSADGEGASLERISPTGPSDHPGNWQTGYFSSPNQWVYVQAIGSLQSQDLLFHLNGTGDLYIDDISVTQIGTTQNLVKNGGMELAWDATWQATGNHSGSKRYSTGQAHTGSALLQIHSTQASADENSGSVKHTLSSFSPNTQYQLSFWLRMNTARGELVVKAGGDGLTLRYPLTTSGITPGFKNSAYSENLPPYISNVSWTPQSPKPTDTVTVQAQVEDTDDIDAVLIEYMTGANNRWGQFITEPMTRDSGTDNNGVWKLTLPKQADKTLVRFRIVAIDNQNTMRIYPSPTEARWTETYFHYADDVKSMLPVVYLYDFGMNDVDGAFRGNSAFVYRPPQASTWTVFDHVIQTPRRRGFGYNVYFLDGYELEDMNSINIVFEPKPRYVMAEWLSYNLYRSLGVPAGKVDQYRFFRNNRDEGYYLMFEQPNKHFIARNGINNEGNLYKIIYGFDHSPTRENIISQHQKRTNLSTGHDDVVEMIQSYYNTSGTKETVFIETYFAVDELINYFVGCQLISDWDGYFNNHFVYHDTESSGLWFIFPWDKDKTWGDSDAYQSILPYYNFYDMPIMFGANGTQPSGKNNRTWWRPPGFISGKFLANPVMKDIYLHRLGYVAYNEFTPEKWIPIIDEMEKRLEPEVVNRAKVIGQSSTSLLNEFHDEVESFRRQVINRREFIINEVEKLIGPVSVDDWTLY